MPRAQIGQSPVFDDDTLGFARGAGSVDEVGSRLWADFHAREACALDLIAGDDASPDVERLTPFCSELRRADQHLRAAIDELMNDTAIGETGVNRKICGTRAHN